MAESADSLSRTFVCIPMPGAFTSTLDQLNREVQQTDRGFSCPRPENAHLTLCFLGEISCGAGDAVRSGMDEVCRELRPLTIRPGEAGFFGSPRRPRVVWLGLGDSPDLAGLQGQLADVVRHAGVALERRAFRPHLTIARVRSPLKRGSLTSAIACINNTNFAEIPVDRVLFMNSRLNGPGPRYTVIHQSLLEGS